MREYKRKQRQDNRFREIEKSKKEEVRKDVVFRLKEKEREKSKKQQVRKDEEYRRKERVKKQEVRKDVSVKEMERLKKQAQRREERTHSRERVRDQNRKKVSRTREEVRRTEQKRLRERRHGDCLESCIEKFHMSIAEGPIYVCCVCHQTWFRESVTLVSDKTLPNRLLQCELWNDCITELRSVNDEKWVCSTCKSSILEYKVPRFSVKNGMFFPQKPPELELHQLEERLVSLRIPFMQLRELPRGGQYCLKGNVVNVPVDVSPTIHALPRNVDETQTVPIKLKRKLTYRTNYQVENVRPLSVICALHWLMNKSALWQNSNIEIDNDWINRLSEQSGQNNSDVTEISDAAQGASASDDDDCDRFSEIGEGGGEGNLDTLLDEPETDMNTVLSFAPGEGQTPISLFSDEDAEYLAFPTIFCGEKRPPQTSRKVRVSYGDICKSELRSHDRRVAMSVPNIFFKMKKLQIKYVADTVTLAMRRCKTKGKKYTVENVLDQQQVNDLVRLDEGYYIFRSLRNSPPYFEKRKKDLFAMIRQLGLPTWFVSLSAADTRWPDLLKILGKLIDKKEYNDEEIEQMDWTERTRLVRSDPVTCVRYFDHRVQQFINIIIKSQHNPIGQVKDFFYRVEFQQRGSPHIHMLIWIESAPKYCVDSEEDVLAYVDKHVSCSHEETQQLEELVNLQMHKHSKTCRKKGEPICRFGFPLPPMPNTVILEPLDDDDEAENFKEIFDRIKCELDKMGDGSEHRDMSFSEFLTDVAQVSEEHYMKAIRSQLKGPKLFLKRCPSEIRINPYMKMVLSAWKANHDLQFVLDAYAVATYVVDYINKSQRGMSRLLHEACKEAKQGNKDLRQQVRHIGNRFLNSVEISAQEASYMTLQLPLTRATREVLFINTSPPDNRTFLLKGKEQLEKLPTQSTDIEAGNIIKRYAVRPRMLESWCLADYASKLNIIFPSKKGTEPCDPVESEVVEQSEGDQGTGNIDQIHQVESDLTGALEKINITLPNGTTIRERTNARVLRFVRFSEKVDPENAYRERLMLFLPWRDEMKDLLAGYDTFSDHYATVKQAVERKRTEYEKNAEALEEAQERVETADRDMHDDVAPTTEHSESVDAEEGTQPATEFAFFDPDRPQAQMVYDIAADVGLPAPTVNQEVQVLAGRLPDEDFRHMIRSLNTKQREFFVHVMKWIKTRKEALHVFLSGGGGVGKSVLLKTIYQALHRHLCSTEGQNPEDCRILVCAPTGKAAYNVEGSTIHHALHITPNRGFQYRKPSTDVLNTMRTKYRHLTVLMVDEVSMVGNQMFNFMNLRLQDIKANNLPFGGLHVILIGDLFQLQPVMDQWIFRDLSSSYGPLASNLWVDLFTMHELTEIMRQKEDSEFAALLNRLREGFHTEADIRSLKEQIITLDQEPSLSSVPHLYPVNRMVDYHNQQVFEASTNEKTTIRAIDTVVGDFSAEVKNKIRERIPDDVSKTAGLMSKLPACICLRYETTCNLNTEDGIVNGASCILRKIQYLRKESSTPSILWVQFDRSRIGQEMRRKYKKYQSQDVDDHWTPIFAVKRNFYTGRNHAPVIRNQFPLRPAVAKTIHKSQGDTMNEVVVDMSKSNMRHGHYVALSRVTKKSGLHIKNLNEEKIKQDPSVVNEMKRLRTEATLQLCYTPVYALEQSTLTFAFHNVRSLHRHIKDMQADPNYMSADIVALAESRLVNGDKDEEYALPGFHTLRNDQADYSDYQHRPPHGLILYIKENVCYDVISCVSTKEIEYTIVKIQYDGETLYFVALYRSPGSRKAIFEEHCQHIRQVVDTDMSVLFCGDFNYDISDNQHGDFLRQMRNLFGCSQFISEPTTNDNTVLDLIFSNNHSVSPSVIDSAWSDHKLIAANIKLI